MQANVKVPDIEFPVRIEKGGDGYWLIECLNLPGCISQGKTRKEALFNIREAIQAWLEAEGTARSKGWAPVWERRSR